MLLKASIFNGCAIKTRVPAVPAPTITTWNQKKLSVCQIGVRKSLEVFYTIFYKIDRVIDSCKVTLNGTQGHWLLLPKSLVF